MVLVVLGVGVVALVVALAGVGVGASMVAAGLAGVSCGPMLVGVGDGSKLAVVAGTPLGVTCCCLGGSLMPIGRLVPADACEFLLSAVGSPPEVVAGFSSSLSDSYMVRCAMGG